MLLFSFLIHSFSQNMNTTGSPSPEEYSGNVYKVVGQMPRFPGCEEIIGTDNEKGKCSKQKMLDFIYTNLEYPEAARIKKIEGMSVVQFIIEKDGTVRNSKVVRSLGIEIDQAALDVVGSFPNWISGEHQGNPVRVQITLPIKFKLEK